MPIPLLTQYTHLPPVTVKQTLAVLVQQHLVVCETFQENVKDVTYYECSCKAAYELLHAGRIIRVVEEKFGQDGALIISNILQLGHAKVSDFLSAYGISKAAPAKKGKKAAATVTAETNGNGHGLIEGAQKTASVETLKSVMGDMLKEHFLVEVKAHDMRPVTDVVTSLRRELTLIVRRQYKSWSDIKVNREVDTQLQAKLKEMNDGPGSGARKTAQTGMKRKAEDAPVVKGKKRQKVSMYDTGDAEVEYEIDETIVVRVNHEKFLVLFRNEVLVQLVEQKLGKVTSQVYQQFLKAIEPRIRRCRDPFGMDVSEDISKDTTLSVFELSKSFPFSDIPLENSIASAEIAGAKAKKRKREQDSDDEEKEDEDDESVNEWDEDEDDEDDDDDLEEKATKKRKNLTIMRQHVMLLAEDSLHFLIFVGNKGMGEYAVNYHALGTRLRQLELEKVVEERFGSIGLRLLRIIKDKGRCEEKQLANLALIKKEEIWSTLSRMQESGHIELQEVPKTNPPQTTRMIFLWFHDDKRANSNLLADVYKAMSRNMQRTNMEKEKRKLLLAKAERSDVQANYEEYMSRSEKNELEIWRSREEKLLVQLMRLDRVVMILRDF